MLIVRRNQPAPEIAVVMAFATMPNAFVTRASPEQLARR